LTTGSFFRYKKDLELTASPTIGGITYSFSSSQIKPGQAASLTVSTDASVAPGTYLISAAAAGAGVTRNTTFRLSVYPTGRTASVPVNATDTRGFSGTADGLRVDASGVVHLVYDDDTLVPNIGDQVFYKQSADDGATFTAPLLISTNPTLSFSPSCRGRLLAGSKRGIRPRLRQG